MDGWADGGLLPSQLPEVTAELLFGVDHWNQAGLAHSELMRQGMRRKGDLMLASVTRMFVDGGGR